MLLLQREKAVEFGIDAVGDGGEVLGAVLEVEIVSLNCQDLAVIFIDSLVVTVVQAAEIFKAHGLLVVAATFLDLRHEVRHR